MKRLIQVSIILTAGLSGCLNASIVPQGFSSYDSVVVVNNYLRMVKTRDSIEQESKDSLNLHLYRVLQIPDMTKLKHEAYLLLMVYPYGSYHWAYFLDRDSGGRYILTTKLLVQVYAPGGPTPYQCKGRTYYTTRDTSVNVFVDTVSEESKKRFTALLGKSYYWAYDNPYEHAGNRAILDGISWDLESVSAFYKGGYTGRDELRYHKNHVHEPEVSSYRDACVFLMSLSGMAKYYMPYAVPE
jgi:hypothetical protein